MGSVPLTAVAGPLDLVERQVNAAIIDGLRRVPKHVPPMEMLRTLVSELSYYDLEHNKNDHEANINKAIRLTSQIAILVANYDRVRKGKPIVFSTGASTYPTHHPCRCVDEPAVTLLSAGR